MLDIHDVFQIITRELADAEKRHGWQVGRYVAMPDHLHFFCAPMAERHVSLQVFVGKFKQWTSKQIGRTLKIEQPVWQPMFFDHVLRSRQAYAEKMDYVWHNPVRAGLVKSPDDWLYAGDLSTK